MPVRHGVQYATTTGKRVPMYDMACAQKVAEHIATFYPQPFTAEQALALIEERCGRFVRGAHKGQLRGWATIEVVTEGGWKRHGPGERNGGVVYPGRILSISIGDDFSGKTYLGTNTHQMPEPLTFSRATTPITQAACTACILRCSGELPWCLRLRHSRPTTPNSP